MSTYWKLWRIQTISTGECHHSQGCWNAQKLCRLTQAWTVKAVKENYRWHFCIQHDGFSGSFAERWGCCAYSRNLRCLIMKPVTWNMKRNTTEMMVPDTSLQSHSFAFCIGTKGSVQDSDGASKTCNFWTYLSVFPCLKIWLIRVIGRPVLWRGKVPCNSKENAKGPPSELHYECRRTWSCEETDLPGLLGELSSGPKNVESTS